MKKLLTTLTIVSVAVALQSQSHAQFSEFTNSAAFSNAITSSNYTETYDGFPALGSGISSPITFLSNGFQYGAFTGINDFYVLNTDAPDQWLSTFFVTTITFTNFSSNISAIGGNFFATDFDTAYTNTPIVVTATLVNSSIFTTNYLPEGPNSFLGLTFTTNLSSLVIANAPGSEEFMTVNNLTVGVVPEPSTYALLGLAAVGLAGYVIRRRRA